MEIPLERTGSGSELKSEIDVNKNVDVELNGFVQLRT
jgi:hypothetical protein